MAGEWRTATVSELQRDGILLVEDGNHGEYRPRPDEFVDRGVAFIRAADMDAGRVLFESAAKINERARGRITKGIGAPGDVLLSHKGTVGKVALVPDEAPAFVCSPQTTFWRTPDEKRLDRKYLYAFLRSSGFRAQLATRAGETDMAPYVSLTSQRGLSVVLPPIDEQRAIAHILGTLDDKIELNRRMSETLEAMARALFKSWFIDFDAVRAKAEGRDPGLAKFIADLFPDRFEDSELGEIPEGWEVGTLGDVLKQRVERCEASDETASRPYVPIDCISSKSLFLSQSKPGVEAQSSLTRFYKGDLLFGAMRPYFHKVCIAPFDGTTRTTAFVLVPKRSQDFGFATLLLHHPDAIDYATRHSTGSTIPYAVWTSSLEDMPAVIPPLQVREGFDAVVRPVLDRIPAPYFENRTLAVLRDTLLPKLISGELRVSQSVLHIVPEPNVINKHDQCE